MQIKRRELRRRRREHQGHSVGSFVFSGCRRFREPRATNVPPHGTVVLAHNSSPLLHAALSKNYRACHRIRDDRWRALWFGLIPCNGAPGKSTSKRESTPERAAAIAQAPAMRRNTSNVARVHALIEATLTFGKRQFRNADSVVA